MTEQFVKWDKRLDLGIALIDEHHRHLVDILNKTYNVIMDDDEKTELKGIITELSDYTAYHFSAEERLMSDYGFPEMQTHRLAHEEFYRHIEEFKSLCKENESLVTVEVLLFLRNWLINHILKEDRKYAKYILAQGYPAGAAGKA